MTGCEVRWAYKSSVLILRVSIALPYSYFVVVQVWCSVLLCSTILCLSLRRCQLLSYVMAYLNIRSLFIAFCFAEKLWCNTESLDCMAYKLILLTSCEVVMFWLLWVLVEITKYFLNVDTRIISQVLRIWTVPALWCATNDKWLWMIFLILQCYVLNLFLVGYCYLRYARLFTWFCIFIRAFAVCFQLAVCCSCLIFWIVHNLVICWGIAVCILKFNTFSVSSYGIVSRRKFLLVICSERIKHWSVVTIDIVPRWPSSTARAGSPWYYGSNWPVVTCRNTPIN